MGRNRQQILLGTAYRLCAPVRSPKLNLRGNVDIIQIVKRKGYFVIRRRDIFPCKTAIAAANECSPRVVIIPGSYKGILHLGKGNVIDIKYRSVSDAVKHYIQVLILCPGFIECGHETHKHPFALLNRFFTAGKGLIRTCIAPSCSHFSTIRRHGLKIYPRTEHVCSRLLVYNRLYIFFGNAGRLPCAVAAGKLQ